MSKRSDILEATLNLIIEEGRQSVTLSKIIRKANVGSGTLYNYFTSKEDLLYKLFEELQEKMNKLILKGYDDKQSIRLRFDKLTVNYLEYGIHHLDELNFIEQYAYWLYKTHQKDYNFNITFYNAVVDLIEQGQNQKIIKDLEIPIILQILSGILIYIAKGYRGKKLELNDTKIKGIINACWDSIKA